MGRATGSLRSNWRFWWEDMRELHMFDGWWSKDVNFVPYPKHIHTVVLFHLLKMCFSFSNLSNLAFEDTGNMVLLFGSNQATSSRVVFFKVDWIVGSVAKQLLIPRCSMYGIFTYIWAIIGVNVGKYSIHGSYDELCVWIYDDLCLSKDWLVLIEQFYHGIAIRILRRYLKDRPTLQQ